MPRPNLLYAKNNPQKSWQVYKLSLFLRGLSEQSPLPKFMGSFLFPAEGEVLSFFAALHHFFAQRRAILGRSGVFLEFFGVSNRVLTFYG